MALLSCRIDERKKKRTHQIIIVRNSQTYTRKRKTKLNNEPIRATIYRCTVVQWHRPINQLTFTWNVRQIDNTKYQKNKICERFMNSFQQFAYSALHTGTICIYFAYLSNFFCCRIISWEMNWIKNLTIVSLPLYWWVRFFGLISWLLLLRLVSSVLFIVFFCCY